MSREADERRAMGGEHSLPLEHTMRVRARRASPTSSTPEPPAHDPRASKARRRHRDARAERRALLLVAGAFVLVGGGLWVGVNLIVAPSSVEVTTASAPPRAVQPPPAKKAPPTPQRSTALDESPNLPALEHLRSIGLTVGAEGIPRVDVDRAPGTDVLAGREACRFAYGVWEFSANQTFRFGSTCGDLGAGWVLGGYEVRGGEIHMSALLDGKVRWTSILKVEHPSMMRTEVLAPGSKGRPTRLRVEQRVTALTRGLHGEDFRSRFEDANSLSAPTPAAPAAPPPPATASGSEKLEQLLSR